MFDFSYSLASSTIISISSAALRIQSFCKLCLREFNSNLSISLAISTLSFTACNKRSTTGNVGMSCSKNHFRKIAKKEDKKICKILYAIFFFCAQMFYFREQFLPRPRVLQIFVYKSFSDGSISKTVIPSFCALAVRPLRCT